MSKYHYKLVIEDQGDRGTNPTVRWFQSDRVMREYVQNLIRHAAKKHIEEVIAGLREDKEDPRRIFDAWKNAATYELDGDLARWREAFENVDNYDGSAALVFWLAGSDQATLTKEVTR